MTTPNGSPELSSSQASKELYVNEMVRRTERGASFYPVVDKDLTSPPGSCADGAVYIIAGSPSGAWAGRPGDIAVAVGPNASNGWYIRDAEEGIFVWVQDEDVLYRCSAGSSPSTWTAYTATPGAINLNELADVDVSSPSDGQVLTYDTSSPTGWKAETPAASGATDLDGLSDVVIASVADGDFLQYDASSPVTWRNRTRASADVGYLYSPQIQDFDDYTLVLADAGKHYYHTSSNSPGHTLTIPANASVAFPIGTVIAIVNENGANSLTLAITSDTLRWGSSTGSRTIAANGTASLLKVAATVWRLTGDGIT